jgi:hypothetical protein
MARKMESPAAAATAPGLAGTVCSEQRRSTFPHYRAQVLASRYGLAIESAMMIAPLALGGAHG